MLDWQLAQLPQRFHHGHKSHTLKKGSSQLVLSCCRQWRRCRLYKKKILCLFLGKINTGWIYKPAALLEQNIVTCFPLSPLVIHPTSVSPLLATIFDGSFTFGLKRPRHAGVCNLPSLYHRRVFAETPYSLAAAPLSLIEPLWLHHGRRIPFGSFVCRFLAYLLYKSG